MNVTEAVTADLGAACSSPEGQSALVLARLLDGGELSGSEHAQVSRELRQAVADARRKPQATAGDKADELKARRAKRHRA